jgi:trans-aconitate 2-methyltransferase
MADEFKGPMNTGAREWDAETYDTVSDPQFEWGMEVLERLELCGDETVVDAGCGSGRVTAELVERLRPGGRVIAVDGSVAMVEKAKERLGETAGYLVSDLLELELEEPVDLVFSTATLHWIPDHDALFARLRAAL